MSNEPTVSTEAASSLTGKGPMSSAVWYAFAAAITAAATLLRFYDLTLKPLHHDEGVNGWFLTTLFKEGIYKYDPENYHGPTLYYISLAFAKAFGLNTYSIRASVAVFGILTVVLIFWLRRYLGDTGTLLAALFVSLSPGMSYISRYFIHETFFVFCSLAIVVSVVLYIERRSAGPGAIAWFGILMFTCFLPSALRAADLVSGQGKWLVWTLSVVIVIVEAALIIVVVKLLLEWDAGRPVYLILASASAALMFATKETAFITLGTMAIACVLAGFWRRLYSSGGGSLFSRRSLMIVSAAAAVAALAASPWLAEGGRWLYENFLGSGKVQEPFVFYSIITLMTVTVAAWYVHIYYAADPTEHAWAEPAELTFGRFRAAIGSGADRILIIAAAAAAFVYVFVVFFSSYFTYADGVKKAFEAYAYWTKTGTKDHTQNGLLGYVKWGMKVESPILLLSALGCLIAFARPIRRFAVFTALWAIGLFLAYTLISYKTPWLAISFILPMCLIAGYGIGELVGSRRMPVRALGAVLALLACGVLSYQTYSLNFVRYDDEEMAYVYAHSKRGMIELVERIDHYAKKSPKGMNATIEIVSPDYWPLTWYLKDYPNANFFGSLIDVNASEMIIAKKNDQDTAVIQRYAAHYRLAGIYPLRPGVELILLVRRDLADNDAAEVYRVLEYQTK
ncbi:MAG: glycosyltransferase family 39 protein [Acidobacteria bacterium]|nr:glycosyltransferase family 39 protein [Acidobacteriota bacterium]MCW5948043.1 glycosyltransferase family 39 protein [Pyrinomonadaceae bacterium]